MAVNQLCISPGSAVQYHRTVDVSFFCVHGRSLQARQTGVWIIRLAMENDAILQPAIKVYQRVFKWNIRSALAFSHDTLLQVFVGTVRCFVWIIIDSRKLCDVPQPMKLNQMLFCAHTQFHNSPNIVIDQLCSFLLDFYWVFFFSDVFFRCFCVYHIFASTSFLSFRKL